MPSTVTDRIDGITTSAAIKTPVRVIATAAITLSGVQTIDGVLLTADSDRVLVTGQADQTTNGIYLVKTSAWTREPDFDGARDCVTGTMVEVRSGTVYGPSLWRLTTTDNPVVIGTSNLTFEQNSFSQQQPYYSPSGATIPPSGNGLYLPAANTLGLAALGALALAITNPASAVNYWQVKGAAIGGSPTLSVLGSDTNITAAYASKGTGVHDFFTNTNVRQLQIGHTALAVNYLLGAGNIASSGPSFGVGGSDTNIAINIYSKGTGDINFSTNTNVTQQFRIAHTATAVNYLGVSGATTGNGPILFANGSDTNIAHRYIAKGTGAHNFYNNGTGSPALMFSITDGGAAAVNYFQVNPGVTTVSPSLIAVGNDTNIDVNIHTKGTGNFFVRTNSSVRGAIDGTGNWYINTAQLATGATTGFLWVTSSAGAPTGAATAPYTGACAIHYDATNNFLYIRSGGTWRKSTVYA